MRRDEDLKVMRRSFYYQETFRPASEHQIRRQV
jgi:hypothetical protein